MTIWTRTKRPSDRIHDVLAGKVKFEDEADAIRSACSFYFYEAACAIIDIPSKEKRRKALNRIPETIRPHVEKEVMRLWKLRREPDDLPQSRFDFGMG